MKCSICSIIIGTDFSDCYSGNRVDACEKPYDYQSIMHFDQNEYNVKIVI